MPSPGRSQPPASGGPGNSPLLPLVLLLAGLVVLVGRFSGLPIAGRRQRLANTPACPVSINRWADQRLATIDQQLRKDYGLDRGTREPLNAIVAALQWIDDRIIDRRIVEAREQIRNTVLESSRCRVEFQP